MTTPWQTMDTAPKDGTRILVSGDWEERATGNRSTGLSDCGVCAWLEKSQSNYGDECGDWVDDEGYYEKYWEPSWWMFIPEVPKNNC